MDKIIFDETASTLQWYDYLIVGIVLLISALIGVYYRFSGGRQKTAAEYFLANHVMNAPMMAFTMAIAFMSAIAILGNAGEAYIYGIRFNFLNVGFCLATPVAAYLYLPVFFRLQNMSVFEYLELRFGPKTRLVASITNFAEMMMTTGVVLYAPAIALEATTGLSSTTSILLIGLICTFYSSIGGVKAVLATDIFQGFLMTATVFCVIGVALYDIEGGFSKVWDIALENNRLELPNSNPDPTIRHSWLSLVVGGFSLFLSDFAIGQLHIQRLLSAKSLKSGQLAYFMTGLLLAGMGFTFGYSGLVIYAWFKGCDPVASGHISSFDQVMPYFAKIRLSKIPGLTGFFIAGIFSAALSTVSAVLNSMSAIVLADYIKPIYRQFGSELAESKAPFFGKILGILNGLLCIGVAFLASNMNGLIQSVIAIKGCIGGPILGLFSLGLFVESANGLGAVIGTIMGLMLTAWLSLGQPRPPVIQLAVSVDQCPNSTLQAVTDYNEKVTAWNTDDYNYFYPYRISYMLYMPIAVIATMLFGYVASAIVRYCSKNPSVEVNPDLFTPIVAARVKRRRENGAKKLSSHVIVLSTKAIVTE